jgi:hypothetical protein
LEWPYFNRIIQRDKALGVGEETLDTTLRPTLLSGKTGCVHTAQSVS